MRKLVIAFFILLLPLSAAAAVSLFPCESRTAAAHAVDAVCLQDCAAASCDELDEPSSSDHLDVVHALALSAPCAPQRSLAFAPMRAGPPGVDYAPLKPPPTC